MASVDEIDKKLLIELRKNGRATLTELSKKLGLSVASIKNRVDKLERVGAIKGYSTLVEPTFLEEYLQALIELELLVEDPRTDLTLHEIGKLDNVLGIYKKTGEFQILIRANFKSMEDLREFLDLLSKKYLRKNLRRWRVTIVLEVLKDGGVSLSRENQRRNSR
ncbi:MULTISPECIES: Lrp/AsnC family transcriptional regulator [Thermococcus]|uniref:Transcription regulator, Lrp/AsnC family n=2 Tax=Thermococcus sibiricus TaxID=172049 RepID=C6A3V0_THESM|nr:MULTISPECIES: Lrp/AsnC family transcriptional regulator [Thermococcus]KUK28614.1 MAG: Transcription regulator, Lrp/AsnC family [Thermococcus sp. 40_45]HII67465.1 Lrp/AsnC family transcriptional regulator [Thermococcaceae archaeon]ACS90295.1 Transcription regulator, Lrp/AsnC family [Thermococcus sibiricus MM 739]KUK17544.1 MAG: Transcription regulator, Lrp/AsnC family [Thermococcus sibiricus]MBC7095325.1 Lrp/AsnC family transcriptional regulator [Thermococcus sp.]